MYHGKYEAKHLPRRRRRRNRSKTGTLLLSLLLIVTMAVGGTVAYLATHSGLIQNSFNACN